MTSSSDPLQKAKVSFVLAVLHAGSSLHVQITSECNMRLLLSQFCFWYLEALPPKCRPFLLSCWHWAPWSCRSQLLSSYLVTLLSPFHPTSSLFLPSQLLRSLWNLWRWRYRSGQPVKNMNCYCELWVAFQFADRNILLVDPPPKKKQVRSFGVETSMLSVCLKMKL